METTISVERPTPFVSFKHNPLPICFDNFILRIDSRRNGDLLIHLLHEPSLCSVATFQSVDEYKEWAETYISKQADMLLLSKAEDFIHSLWASYAESIFRIKIRLSPQYQCWCDEVSVELNQIVIDDGNA